jgi:hypothetical protein
VADNEGIAVKLPHHKSALVPREKIADYLLSLTHPQDRHKAAFFSSFGFSTENWEILADSLKRQVADHPVTKVETTPFGTRYVVEGIMKMPDGRTPSIRSVWFVAEGDEIPRFATAYPTKGGR